MAKWIAGNRLILLHSNAGYFPALLQAIAGAQREVFLESYIFAHDRTGQAVAATLIEAARRGVRVRVLVDGFGARHFATDFLPTLTDGGVQAMIYRPEIARFRLRRHRLRRLHRKLAVIDGALAFVGGINVIDDDSAPPELRPRYDYAVQVEGPVVRKIHAAMRRMWEIVAWANFKRRYRIMDARSEPPALAGRQTAAFLMRDNFRHRNEIANAYLAAIAGAKREILIANAYFLPGIRMRRALVAAARRGVAVRILLQGRSDHPLVRFATCALYRTLIGNGIEVVEYSGGFLHAKVAVIDESWATVGSSNMDPMSLLLAKEANLVIRDEAFASELRASLNDAICQQSQPVQADDLKKMPISQRVLCWLSYAAVRMLVGLAGYDPAPWQPDEDDDS